MIGVLTIPSEYDLYPRDLFSYVPDSLHLMGESAFSNSVPIKYDLDEKNLREKIKKTNGIILYGPTSEIDL